MRTILASSLSALTVLMIAFITFIIASADKPTMAEVKECVDERVESLKEDSTAIQADVKAMRKQLHEIDTLTQLTAKDVSLILETLNGERSP